MLKNSGNKFFIIILFIFLVIRAEMVYSQTVSDMAGKLNRIVFGNQAGILVIIDKPGGKVVYYRCLDCEFQAKYTDDQLVKIFDSLGIDKNNLDRTVSFLINNYSRLPQVQTIIMLGALGSAPPSMMNSQSMLEIRQFLSNMLRQRANVVTHRQTILSLALIDSVDESTIDAVTTFYEKNNNLWETWPVRPFFIMHAAEIQNMPSFDKIKNRVAKIDKLYTEEIVKALSKPSSVHVMPSASTVVIEGTKLNVSSDRSIDRSDSSAERSDDRFNPSHQ